MGTNYSHIDLAERRRIQQMRDAKFSVFVIRTVVGKRVVLKTLTVGCAAVFTAALTTLTAPVGP